MAGACIISPGGRGGVGGIQTYARMIAKRLERDHPDRPVFVLDPRGPSAWLSPLWLAAALARLVWLGASGRAEVAHLQVSERSSFARKGALALTAGALGMRVVLHHHGAELIPFVRGAPRWAHAAIGRLVRAADGNVVLGGVWARFLIEELGARPERVAVLANALPDLPAAAAGPREGPFRVLFLAVMTRRKGGATLLGALTRLHASGLAFEAVLAGDGPDRADCMAEALRRGIAGRCRFPGRVPPEEAARLMAEADVLVCASSHEGLPIAILEALRAGVPVLTTPVGAIPEALPDGDGALHFPVGDAAALAGHLAVIAAEPERRRALSAAARRAFERRFGLDGHMRALRRIYGWEERDASDVA